MRQSPQPGLQAHGGHVPLPGAELQPEEGRRQAGIQRKRAVLGKGRAAAGRGRVCRGNRVRPSEGRERGRRCLEGSSPGPLLGS